MSSLKKYEMEETSVLHLRDAGDALMYADGENGEPDISKPMRAHLFGSGSKQYAKAINARQNHSVDLLKRHGKTKESAEDAAHTQAIFLAACTQSFDNVESETGAIGDALSIEVYTNQKLSFIRDQIGVYIQDTANFTKGSMKP